MSETPGQSSTQRRAVIYVRESMDKYGDARAVDRFQAQCEQLCTRRGLAVTRVLCDNDVRATDGNHGDGFHTVLAMMKNRQMDYLVVPVVDRFLRNPRQLEDLIDMTEGTGVVVLATSGDIDLSHDQGRLVARILVSVAKAEMERKSARHREANEQAAKRGQRRLGTPRPFGFSSDDHVTHVPAERDAIRDAAGMLLGGSTVSEVMRNWNARGLVSAQGGRAVTRNTVTTVLRNPALAGLAVYRGEVVGQGNWEPILAEGTWRAVAGLLDDPARKPPRGVRTLLGGLARCYCGNVIQGTRSQRGSAIYRCNPETRNGNPGPHATVRIAAIDDFAERVIVARLARDDLAELVTPARPEVTPLREEAGSIRRNLDELAADRALGLVSRSQMIAATERGNARLEQVTRELAEAAGQSVLAPFAAGDNAARVWESLDLARKRAVIGELATVTLHPAGRGARVFNPKTVQIAWNSHS